MNTNSFIVVTGAYGFIGSCMVSYLNQQGYENLILVDEFDRDEKELNLLNKKYKVRVERANFFEWLKIEKPVVDFIFHLGARTDTTEFDYAIHEALNLEYSKKIWNYCTKFHVPLVYASSAATYGNGEAGYEDDQSKIENLQPLNPYGISKNEFDKWVLKQEATALPGMWAPPFWAGLKFFNVYGPNEYHKARMASVIFHSFNQIQEKGLVKLFKSHKEGIKDGEQLRDFVYVKDVVAICYWLMQNKPLSALYNLGTGKARSFNDLVASCYTALDLPTQIQYIDMPADIRDKYQYFTEAKMNKLKTAGYTTPFYSLEEGVREYVQNYLVKKSFY
ncbi:MAG: ADP-glyceromanno-heptose 6-epimerase [Chitinophagaceae bacterium]